MVRIATVKDAEQLGVLNDAFNGKGKTTILAKIGIEGVNSNLATALRTVVVVVMAWGMVFLTNAQSGINDISFYFLTREIYSKVSFRMFFNWGWYIADGIVNDYFVLDFI